MLVRFTVENCLSFRDRVEFSMVASERVLRHSEHVIHAENSKGPNLLELGVVYGGNASGKSNLVKAINLTLQLIRNPTRPEERIDHKPFKLDPECLRKPSRFEFEIKTRERVFASGFSTTAKRVSEEWLVEIGENTERVVFERKQDSIDFGDLRLDSDQSQFLQFTAKGTLPNRLFLGECRERNVPVQVPSATEISDVVRWFTSVPFCIFPDTRFEPLALIAHVSADFRQELERYLSCFDTGIGELRLQAAKREKLNIPDEVRFKVETDMERLPWAMVEARDGSLWVLERQDEGEVSAWKLVTKHRRRNGASDVDFEANEESDGTRRLMHLVPAMMVLMRNDLVGIIDEMDRSLHPAILHSYVANFLKYSVCCPSQLIVTTHDTTLLNEPFLRRDEVWFVEKAPDQASRLVSLEEFKDVDRIDDLQRGYLEGRFGGVPVLKGFSWLGSDDGKGA